jgi:hypothetical protein
LGKLTLIARQRRLRSRRGSEDYMKCNDCGEPYETTKATRSDVCSTCWDMRLRFVNGEIAECGSEDFIAIQRSMASGRGTAKRRIMKILQRAAK